MFETIVAEMDTDNSGKISSDEFEKIMGNRAAVRELVSVSVNPEVLVDLAKEWFVDPATGQDLPDGIAIADFMTKVLELRGGQNVLIRDLQLVHKNAKGKFSEISVLIGEIESKMKRIRKKMATSSG